MLDETTKDLSTKMDKALLSLDHDLKGLRIGRASVNFLDPVIVEVYGIKTPINQLATINTPDAKSISIQVWDAGLVKSIEKAIVESNLGVNPVADGQLIAIKLPVLSEERRKELTKLAHKYGENNKILGKSREFE